MATNLDATRERVLELSYRIVLVDGEDERVVKASSYLRKQGAIEPVLLGDESIVQERLKSLSSSVELEVINPSESPLFEDFAELYQEKIRGVALSRA